MVMLLDIHHSINLSVVILYSASLSSHHSLIIHILRADLCVQVAHLWKKISVMGALKGCLQLLVEGFTIYRCQCEQCRDKDLGGAQQFRYCKEAVNASAKLNFDIQLAYKLCDTAAYIPHDQTGLFYYSITYQLNAFLPLERILTT